MQFEYNALTRRFTFTHQDLPAVSIQGAATWATYRLQPAGRLLKVSLASPKCSTHEEPLADLHGTGSQLVLRSPEEAAGVELVYRLNIYDSQPFLLFQLSVVNRCNHPIYLHECCLLDANPSTSGRVQLGQASHGLRFFKVGWHGWAYTGLRHAMEQDSRSWLDKLARLSYTNPQTIPPRRKGEFSSEGWGILVGEAACLVAGFASTAHQFGQLYACTRPGEQALRLVTQMDGVLLEPGQVRDSEWGYLQFVPSTNPQPEVDFVATVARQMQSRVPKDAPAPMWTHWYQYFHAISEDLLLRSLQLLDDHRAAVPYRMVELDDGYQAAWGDWTTTNARFPHGLEWLAGQITARGFSPGLWLAPFVVQQKSLLAGQHPGWLVTGRRGLPINAGFQYNMRTHALDLTQPAVLDHLQQLASTLTRQWGYGMLKIDFLNAGALPGRRFNPKLTRAEALRLGLEAIRRGAGETAFLLGCGCPFGPAIGIVDAMRIGPDTAPSWNPYFHWLGWARPLIKSNPSIPALRNALRHTLNLSSLQRKWWWNDPDCLLVRDADSRLSEAEVHSAVTLTGLSGGMLVSSDDLRNVSPQRLRWISLLIPNLGLQGLPLDRLEREMPAIYQVKVEHNGHAWQLVGLFNWSDRPADLQLKFSDLGYPPEVRLQVFDFWARRYLWVHKSGLAFEAVPAHGCKLLRLCEAADAPQLVGDTLHISMGAELSALRIVDNRLEIGLVGMGRRLEGDLWVRLDAVVKAAVCNGQQLNIEAVGENIYRVGIALGES